jgi:carboxymethylenebutenolidase
MKNPSVILAVLFVLVFGGWLAYWDDAPMKNAEMLDAGKTTEILTESDVAYFSGAKGFFARPKADGDHPGVVMIHENRGLRPEIRATAEQLAREGYQVLAVDLFEGKTAEDQAGARALTSNFKQDVAVQNMRAAASFLRQKGAGKIASLGWCFGGKQSLELAMSGEPLVATVVYYGGGMATTTERLAPIKWPVLGIFGDKDQAIPVATVRAFENSLNTLGVENEIHIYPGVGHAFANPSGMNYAPQETKDAWAKTIAFLNAHLR